MQVSVDRKIYAPLVLCLLATCALTFLLITTTVLAGHDNGDNQCISDVKVISLGGANTFAVNGQSPTVGFEDRHKHDTKENEVILQVDTEPTATVKIPESDIGDGGSDKGNWNSISNTTSLEVRIRDASRQGSDITSIYVDVHDTDCGNTDPTAVDDGDNSAQICNGISPQDIYVLANDSDPDGDSLSITDVDNTTKLGGTATISDDGVTDFIRYTPPSEEGRDEFNYTIRDGNGGKDTATVKVNLSKGGCTGDIYVNFQSTDGGSVSVPDGKVHYNGKPCDTSGGIGLKCENVELYDDGRDALINQSFITPPEGYKVKESNWVNKVEAEETYDQPNKSELGF